MLPALGALDDTELPNVPDRHRQETGEVPADDSGDGVREQPNLLARALDDAAQLSLNESIRILEMRENADDADTFGIIIRAN